LSLVSHQGAGLVGEYVGTRVINGKNVGEVRCAASRVSSGP